MGECACVCVFVRAWVRVCAFVRACVRIRTYSPARTNTHSHPHEHTYTNTHTRIHTRTHTHPHTHNKGSNLKRRRAYQQWWEAFPSTFDYHTHRHTHERRVCYFLHNISAQTLLHFKAHCSIPGTKYKPHVIAS